VTLSYRSCPGRTAWRKTSDRMVQQLSLGDEMGEWVGGVTGMKRPGEETRGRLLSLLWHCLGRLWTCLSWGITGTAVSTVSTIRFFLVPFRCAGTRHAFYLRS